MKSAIILSSLTLVTSYVPNTSRHGRPLDRLNYKTHEFEYGTGDDRVRTLTSDDRVSVLKVLEMEGGTVRVKRRKQHQSDVTSFSKTQTTSASVTTHPSTIWSDVDADRFSLASLLDPPAPPLEKADIAQTTSPVPPTKSTSRISTSKSTITSLQSIDDYNHHITSNESNQLKLIRFSAPWCQVCRTTNVAFERMASKLSKGGDVQFYSVLIDSNQPLDTKNVLKEHLEVQAVPTGVLYHPSKGVIGQVNLNRSNLSELKKRLEGYVSGALHRQGEMMWMEALVMGLEVGQSKMQVKRDE